MMKRFSVAKYLEHRQKTQGLSDSTMDVLKAFDTMLECEGWTIDEVNQKKGVCLKEWCEDDEIDLVQVVSDFFHV